MNKRWVKNYLRVMVRNVAKDYEKASKREKQMIEETKTLFDRRTEPSAEDNAIFEDDAVYLEKCVPCTYERRKGTYSDEIYIQYECKRNRQYS